MLLSRAHRGLGCCPLRLIVVATLLGSSCTRCCCDALLRRRRFTGLDHLKISMLRSCSLCAPPPPPSLPPPSPPSPSSLLLLHLRLSATASSLLHIQVRDRSLLSSKTPTINPRQPLSAGAVELTLLTFRSQEWQTVTILIVAHLSTYRGTHGRLPPWSED